MRRQGFAVQFSFLTVALALWMGFLNIVPPLRIVRGTPHPHDGSEGNRPGNVLYPNIYGGRAQEQWERDQKRVEFAKFISANTTFNGDFKNGWRVLLDNKRDYVASIFLQTIFNGHFGHYSPVGKRKWEDTRIHMTNDQIRIVHRLGDACIRDQPTGCIPYIMCHIC